MAEILLTRKQLSEKLQVNPKTLKNWEDKGVLPSHKMGGVIRYVESEVEVALLNKTNKNTSHG